VKTASLKARFRPCIMDETRDTCEESAADMGDELAFVGQARSGPMAPAAEETPSESKSARAVIEQKTACHKLDESLGTQRTEGSRGGFSSAWSAIPSTLFSNCPIWDMPDEDDGSREICAAVCGT
jgi:hypothetical protein